MLISNAMGSYFSRRLYWKYFHLCARKVRLSPRLRNQAVFYAWRLSEPGDASDWGDEKSGMWCGFFCTLLKIASDQRAHKHKMFETHLQRKHAPPSWATFDQNPTKASWRIRMSVFLCYDYYVICTYFCVPFVKCMPHIWITTSEIHIWSQYTAFSSQNLVSSHPAARQANEWALWIRRA